MRKPKKLSLAETGFTARSVKTTRKEVFLSEMERIVPWSDLEALIEPYYFKADDQGGHPAMGLSAMLRISFFAFKSL